MIYKCLIAISWTLWLVILIISVVWLCNKSIKDYNSQLAFGNDPDGLLTVVLIVVIEMVIVQLGYMFKDKRKLNLKDVKDLIRGKIDTPLNELWDTYE